MIEVHCSICGLKILVPPTVQGRVGICFGCGGQLAVPQSTKSAESTYLRYSKGDRIADRYIIEKSVGSGGMGVVYMAKDSLIEEEVALKFMNPSALRTQRGQKMFIKEAQVARRLRHENIVAVHDVSTTAEGILYLSMEFIKGNTLRSFLRSQRVARKLVDVRMAIELTLQILRALEYAHQTVVHRDLKPENVMMLPGERAKVLDFGLAIVADEQEAQTQSPPSNPERIIGTTAYASPEQKRHQPIDFRSDLFTMGLIVHELLTLRTPIDESVAIMDVRHDVAPSIVSIVDKALIDDRENRWQSAGEFAQALQDAYDESYRKRRVVEYKTKTGVQVSTEHMAYLEGGNFLMGNNAVPVEAPEREVFVNPFYLDKCPVTVEEYGMFLEATGHPESEFWQNPEFNGPRQPVTGVSWEDARAYAAWVGKSLPTEKQWEFAARGRENRPYAWGSLEPDTARCNFADYLGMPSIVTMHDTGASPEGVMDLGGNIHEWTLDGYTPYIVGDNGRKKSRKNAARRVVRGGSWHSQAKELRTSSRKGLFPESRLTTVGFRCAISAKDLKKAKRD